MRGNEELTQHEKIFVVMLRGMKDGATPNIWATRWWRASHFQQECYGIFVGYEATARMSELVKQYPFAFELRQNGRFREMKIAATDMKLLHSKLPHFLARHLVLEGIVK